MKKYIYTIIALLGLVACQKGEFEIERGNDPQSPKKDIIPMVIDFSASETKTVYTNLHMSWDGTEKLGLFSETAYYEWAMEGNKYFNKPVANVKMQVKDGLAGPGANFEIDSSYASDTPALTGRFGWDKSAENCDFFIYYPYQEKAKMATSVHAVPFCLPAVQTQQPASDNPAHFGEYDFIYSSARLEIPSQAEEKDVIEAPLNFTFHHVFSILKFTVTNSLSKEVHLRGVKVETTDGTVLAGDMTIDLATSEITAGQTISDGGQVEAGEGSASAMTLLSAPYTYKTGSFVVDVFVQAADLKGKNIVCTAIFDEGIQQFSFAPTKSFERGKTYTHTLKVNKLTDLNPAEYDLKVLSFEDADYKGTELNYWSSLIDPAQYMGSLLYGETRYGFYDKGNTELAHEFPFNWGDYKFWGGGHAVSCYGTSDTRKHKSYTDQLTVYSASASDSIDTAGCGHGASDNFCIHYGYRDSSGYSADNLPQIYFKDGMPRVIDCMWVNNTSYALDTFIYGNDMSAALGATDWVKIVATGTDFFGGTHTAEFYLAQGKDQIVKQWTKFDLSGLGAVTKVEFNITGSCDNGYGFSLPAYFAYDDVTVRFAKN